MTRVLIKNLILITALMNAGNSFCMLTSITMWRQRDSQYKTEQIKDLFVNKYPNALKDMEDYHRKNGVYRYIIVKNKETDTYYIKTNANTINQGKNWGEMPLLNNEEKIENFSIELKKNGNFYHIKKIIDIYAEYKDIVNSKSKDKDLASLYTTFDKIHDPLWYYTKEYVTPVSVIFVGSLFAIFGMSYCSWKYGK